MQSLADLQSALRDAVIRGDFASIASLFSGGEKAERRLAIHHRHYQASLTKALLEKFPATVWLVGSQMVTEAASIFVAKHPPAVPCIAEYGAAFPSFLAKFPGAKRTPYLQEFAELEWHVSHVAIAVDTPPVPIEEIRAIEAYELPEVALLLQTGLRYLQASWPVDDLLRIYLAETRPEHFEFGPANVHLEIRGSRGEFSMNRHGPAEFFFRRSVSLGRPIGDSAEEALQTDSNFDPGKALRSLFEGGLVAAIEQPRNGANNGAR